MKSTQIFTGHNLMLQDVQAIGPVMTEHKAASFMTTRTLYMEITLRGGATLRHNEVQQTLMGGETSEREATKWQTAVEKLETERAKLIDQWEYDLSFPNT